jgi:hypothetical protein
MLLHKLLVDVSKLQPEFILPVFIYKIQLCLTEPGLP